MFNNFNVVKTSTSESYAQVDIRVVTKLLHDFHSCLCIQLQRNRGKRVCHKLSRKLCLFELGINA